MKMSKILKSLALIPMAFALSVSGFSTAFSNELPSVQIPPVNEDSGVGGGPVIFPLDVQLISPFTYIGHSAYENTFVLDP